MSELMKPEEMRKLADRHLIVSREDRVEARRTCPEYTENVGCVIEASLTSEEARRTSRELFPNAKKVGISVYPFTVLKERQFESYQMDHPEVAWATVFWECFSSFMKELFPWGGAGLWESVMSYYFTNPGPVYQKLNRDPLGLNLTDVNMHEGWAKVIAHFSKKCGYDFVVFDGNVTRFIGDRELDVPWIGTWENLIADVEANGLPVYSTSIGPSSYMPGHFSGNVWEDAIVRRRGRLGRMEKELRLKNIIGPSRTVDDEGNEHFDGLHSYCATALNNYAKNDVFCWDPKDYVLSDAASAERDFMFNLGAWMCLRRPGQEGPYLRCDSDFDKRNVFVNPFEVLDPGVFEQILDIEVEYVSRYRGGLFRATGYDSTGRRWHISWNPTARKRGNTDAFSSRLMRANR